MYKYRVVLTCWDYDNPKPYPDDMSGVKLSLFPSEEEANAAIEECVQQELVCLNDLDTDSPREKEPIEDSQGNIIGYDYPFRVDDCGDHDNIIRFWDGDDYRPVTAYNIHKLFCPDEDLSKCNYFQYRGFWIYANKNHNRFAIEQYDVRLAMKYTLQSALRWIDDLQLTVEQSHSKILKQAFSPMSSLEIQIKNAQSKAQAGKVSEGPARNPVEIGRD